MSIVDSASNNQVLSGRNVRPVHWKEAAILFNTTRSYIRALKEYPDAFLDAQGVQVSDGCGRMRCARWREELYRQVEQHTRGETNIEGPSDGGQKKKNRRLLLTLEADILARAGQFNSARSRTGRPTNWREIAQYYITCKKFHLVKLQYPTAFLSADGSPATDSCAKMRVLRWKEDYFLELLGGPSVDQNVPTYGCEVDKALAAACKDLIDRGMPLDEAVLWDLLLLELRKSKTHISEDNLKSIHRVWAGNFFKRHRLQIPVKVGSTPLFSPTILVSQRSHEESAAQNIVTQPDHRDAALPSSSHSLDYSCIDSFVGSLENTPNELGTARQMPGWQEAAQLFVVCGTYKIVKKHFPHFFFDEKGQRLSIVDGSILCQKWKEDLKVEHSELGMTV